MLKYFRPWPIELNSMPVDEAKHVCVGVVPGKLATPMGKGVKCMYVMKFFVDNSKKRKPICRNRYGYQSG